MLGGGGGTRSGIKLENCGYKRHEFEQRRCALDRRLRHGIMHRVRFAAKFDRSKKLRNCTGLLACKVRRESVARALCRFELYFEPHVRLVSRIIDHHLYTSTYFLGDCVLYITGRVRSFREVNVALFVPRNDPYWQNFDCGSYSHNLQRDIRRRAENHVNERNATTVRIDGTGNNNIAVSVHTIPQTSLFSSKNSAAQRCSSRVATTSYELIYRVEISLHEQQPSGSESQRSQTSRSALPWQPLILYIYRGNERSNVTQDCNSEIGPIMDIGTKDVLWSLAEAVKCMREPISQIRHTEATVSIEQPVSPTARAETIESLGRRREGSNVGERDALVVRDERVVRDDRVVGDERVVKQRASAVQQAPVVVRRWPPTKVAQNERFEQIRSFARTTFFLRGCYHCDREVPTERSDIRRITVCKDHSVFIYAWTDFTRDILRFYPCHRNRPRPFLMFIQDRATALKLLTRVATRNFPTLQLVTTRVGIDHADRRTISRPIPVTNVLYVFKSNFDDNYEIDVTYSPEDRDPLTNPSLSVGLSGKILVPSDGRGNNNESPRRRKNRAARASIGQFQRPNDFDEINAASSREDCDENTRTTSYTDVQDIHEQTILLTNYEIERFECTTAPHTLENNDACEDTVTLYACRNRNGDVLPGLRKRLCEFVRCIDFHDNRPSTTESTDNPLSCLAYSFLRYDETGPVGDNLCRTRYLYEKFFYRWLSRTWRRATSKCGTRMRRAVRKWLSFTYAPREKSIVIRNLAKHFYNCMSIHCGERNSQLAVQGTNDYY